MVQLTVGCWETTWPCQQPTLPARLLKGKSVFSNATQLEWAQLDRPRVPKFSVVLVSAG